MPRGYKKNNKDVVRLSTKESRGGGSRPKQSKHKRSRRRRRFRPKGGQRNAHPMPNLSRAEALLDGSKYERPRTMAASSTASSIPQKLCDAKNNIAPPCNKACCRPPVIQGLQQLLAEEAPQQPSYKDVLVTPLEQDQYVFVGMQKVREGTYYRRFRQEQYDDYSEKLSFDSQGIAKFHPERYSAFRRKHRGCETCDFGGYSSYGLNEHYTDYELTVLPSLEAAVSGRLAYKPFRKQLQHLITKVYDWKEELYMSNYDGNNQEEREIVRKLNNECKWTTYRIVYRLKAYIANEACAQSELSFLSLAIYKCHLQQLAIEGGCGGWDSFKVAVPHRSLSSIGIIVQCVKPFLLDVEA